MHRLAIGLWLALLAPTAVNAQTLHYEAQVTPGGEIELVPQDDASPLVKRLDQSTGGAQLQMGQTPAEKVYLWKDAVGDVKGIFSSEEQLSLQELQAGDSVEALKVNQASGQSSFASVTAEQMQEVAREAAKLLLQAARDSACGFEPKPETVTPSVEVSFSLFAGASFQVSAEWQVSKLCP